MFQKPPTSPVFSRLEKDILTWWKENRILEKSISNRDSKNSKTFYDGPITANGDPHIGHALTFSMKDLYPRFWTMKGFRVTRSLGWDCQGLPVEFEIEKSLGFKEKKDIENLGIEKFNQLCRELVTDRRGKIVELEELIGRLTNAEEEYATMDKNYIESIWWSLKELHTKGLLYEGFKVVPYSTRAGTTLSNAEVALGGYKNFVDPAITVMFGLKSDPTVMLLAWTTTPWTMPGNLGLAIGKDIAYVKVKGTDPTNTYILAKDALGNVFKGDPYTIIEEIKAEDLVGKEYNPPFDFYLGRENAHKIYYGDHVTADSGTGIVHLAPYGAEDNDIFQQVGIKSFDYLDEQGDFTNEIKPYAGLNYRVANEKIIEDLKRFNRLFRQENYEHEMPMCWRTNTPLIYKPITSWYLKMSSLRKELENNNSQVNWSPAHIKEGRFGNWLSEIKDWGISRSRYWGTPLPIWKSESGKTIIIGSFEELKKYSGIEIDDPHKPFVDDIIFTFENEEYKRIPDVLDVWYDSGAMPFARFHYPFENKEKFESKFPAEYIAEGVDQTRGWFYTLLAISTALFNKPPYKNVVVNGTILADDGSKLSKSKKNYVEPSILINQFGADTVRLNFFLSPIASGEDATVSPKSLKIFMQEITLPLWNIFSFFVTYAGIHKFEFDEKLVGNIRKNNDEHIWDHIPFDDIDDEIDAWILWQLQNTIETVNNSLDKFEIPKAGRSIKELIDNISKWYIRRSRNRFTDGDTDALATLYYVLIETIKLLAPFTPFISEYIYRELAGKYSENIPESVHLCDYPVADKKFLEEYPTTAPEMEVIRAICEMGHYLRTTKQLKVRQPLAKLYIWSENQVLPALQPWMESLIANELNVLEVSNSQNFEESDKLVVASLEGKNLKIGLDIEITPELRTQGLIREISRIIQSERKNKRFIQGEKVKIEYFTENSEINQLIANYSAEISQKIDASEFKKVEVALEDMTEIKFLDSVFKIKILKS